MKSLIKYKKIYPNLRKVMQPSSNKNVLQQTVLCYIEEFDHVVVVVVVVVAAAAAVVYLFEYLINYTRPT